MKPFKSFVWVLALCMVSVPFSAWGTDTLILQEQTEPAGADLTYYAHTEITAGPGYVIQEGGHVKLKAGSRVTLNPGFQARRGSALKIEIGLDAEAPVLISGYPFQNSTVATQGEPLSLLVTFGDDLSGVKTVMLLDGSGTDITSSAVITENTLEYVIQDPVDGACRFTLVLEDMEGNVREIPLDFIIDATLPLTTASVESGTFDTAFSVDLTCSEAAVIYYSTDGYSPFEGAENTMFAPAPVIGIPVEHNMRLQFFAVDTAGNREETHGEVYLYSEIPKPVTHVTATWNPQLKRVELAWDASSAAGYHVYRCISPVDRKILNESRWIGFSAPERLRLSDDLVAGTAYNDTAVVFGATYAYSVSAVSAGGVEGMVSELVCLDVTTTEKATEKSEAVSRAKAWLASRQNEQGYWGEKESRRMLATSQVLNAFNRAREDNAGIRQGLYYLRGHFADNNDYLSRKILTLKGYAQNVDAFVNRLVSQSILSGEKIRGWGLQKRYRFDAFDTAVGAKALSCSSRDVFSIFNDYDMRVYLNSPEYEGYGWVPGKETSIYVSAFAYDVLKTVPSGIYWPITPLLLHFDGEGTVFTDDSTDGETHQIVSHNGVSQTKSVFKEGGSSAYFDGVDDYLSIKNSFDFNFGKDPFSIEFWMCPESYPETDKKKRICESSDENGSWTLSFMEDFRAPGSEMYQIYWASKQTGIVNTVAYSRSKGPEFWVLNKWYHIGLEKTADNFFKIFINGVLSGPPVGANNFTNPNYPYGLWGWVDGTVFFPTGDIRIGLQDSDSPDRWAFHGWLDDFKITTNRSLPDEIDSSWIRDFRNQDGSFGNGLTDTAAVMLWYDMTPEERDAAGQYLMAQQNPNGSWKDDPYVSGLCLEAILTY